MKFDPNGRLLKVYTGSFNIVHSLTLQEEKDALCVADRENSRVVCIHAGLKEGPGQPSFGSPYGPAGYKGKNVGRVFAVAAKGTEIKPVNDTAPKKIRDLDDVTFSRSRPICEMLMRLCFSFAGQQLYAVFGSIFLGMSDGKTFDLDSLNTLSRWTPSKVRDDAFYQSKIIQRLILPLFWLLVRNMFNMMFFLF